MKINKSIVLALALFGVLAFVPAYSYAEDTTATSTPVMSQILNKVGSAFKARAAIGTGTVSSKSTTNLVVTKDGKNYTVNFDSNTKLRRRFWGTSSLDEIQVGDTVNIIGKWSDDSHTTIQAKLVRDISIQKRFGIFFGTITSMTTNGWAMTTVNRGNQTVTTSSSTKFINRKGETITQADVKVGDRVRARGLWDKTNSTITEVNAVKDFSIPTQTK